MSGSLIGSTRRTITSPSPRKSPLRPPALRVSLVAGGLNGDFLGDGEVIVLRVLPINEPDIYCVLAHPGLHLHGVAQQLIHGPVAVIEALAGVARRLVEQMQRSRDQRLVVTLRFA